MKISLRRVLWALSVLIVFLWLLFSTDIIAAIRNRSVQIRTYSTYDVSPVGTPFFEIGDLGATSATRYFQVKEDLFDSVSICGWIYPLSPEFREENAETIILHSDSVTYEIFPESIRLNWIGNYFIDLDPSPQNYTGFLFDFCPLGFPSGDYEVYLKTVSKVDSSVTSLVNTGYHLMRQPGKTTVEFRPSEKIDAVENPKEWANAGIEYIRRDGDGNLLIKGWGILDGVNAEQTRCVIQVSDENGYVGTYTSIPYAITYINDYFDSDLYLNSGFVASIPEFTGTQVELDIYVNYQGEYYRCSYNFSSDDDFSEVTSVNKY